MKVLSIGNSFSTDAHRYFHKLAVHNGEKLKAVNLYIGGCSLRTHYINMLEDNRAYSFEFNGERTGIFVSIKEALISDEWDYVTLQQSSPQSPKYETYTPYITELAAYVRKYCPHARIAIHNTWAYEAESEKLLNVVHFDTPRAMLDAVCECYEQAAKDIGANIIIPSGQAMLRASELGIEKVHRDTFHASLGAGRYLLALTWYRALFGKDISGDDFAGFDVPVSDEERDTVKRAVAQVFGDKPAEAV